ncbi:stage III sporulation protein AD [Cerasibacillus terrae]|uniref:Stage III sporulation protein AD n=1 Tax=Cerasibacillus terrae TaxID=2498845 RepID=A0A5C8P453_9BACI|nr:stage III sporulation protein AD [Cerasibacillus terrae]TXL67946.1 stage III sporulation protein AD [Cerasibacillus terrae]
MEIIHLVGIGIIASILYITLRELGTTFGFLIILIASVIIFLAVIKQIGTIFQLIHHLGQKASIEGMYIGTILKIIGIAYITEIGADLTRDAGLHGVATKIELAGKIFILIIAIPIITTVIESILNFLPIT